MHKPQHHAATSTHTHCKIWRFTLCDPATYCVIGTCIDLAAKVLLWQDHTPVIVHSTSGPVTKVCDLCCTFENLQTTADLTQKMPNHCIKRYFEIWKSLSAKNCNLSGLALSCLCFHSAVNDSLKPKAASGVEFSWCDLSFHKPLLLSSTTKSLRILLLNQSI